MTGLVQSEALERAEALVEQAEAEAVRIVRTLLTRMLEVAEDVWAEAKSARDDGPPGR